VVLNPREPCEEVILLLLFALLKLLLNHELRRHEAHRSLTASVHDAARRQFFAVLRRALSF
jgi:hypothetical protein